MKHSERLTAALAPEDTVAVDALEGRVRDAVAAAMEGDHAPVAALLAETREHEAWEERSHVAWVLADRSLRAPQWLDAWQEQEPESPDALLVRSQLLVLQAWEVRSGVRADQVADEQWRAFFAVLEAATPVVSEAVAASPHDPTPWTVALQHGMGAGASREVFDDYRDAFMEVAPTHHASHRAALTHLMAKWHGSHEESFAYADWAAGRAEPESRLHTLPLVAEYEHLVEVGRAAAIEARGERIDRAITLARAWVDAYGHLDPRGAEETRNLLALVLFLTERPAEAYEQMERIGARATAYPWLYYGEPRDTFLTYRKHIVTRYAAELQ